MQRLRQDLLDAASIDAGQLSVDPLPREAAYLADGVMEWFEPLAAEQSLSLSLQLDPALPPVMADHDRVLQVLGNLVGNAIKFTPAAGKITLSVMAVPEGVRFDVTDTGPGIAPDDLPHIFDRFWRTRDGNRTGAGLGLAIARGIVEAHGGRMWAESEPGEGSSFRFILPAATAAAAVSPSP